MVRHAGCNVPTFRRPGGQAGLEERPCRMPPGLAPAISQLSEEAHWIRLLDDWTGRGGGRDSADGADPSCRYAVRLMQPSSRRRGVGRRVRRALGHRKTQLHSRRATTRQPTMVFPGSFVPSARRRRSRTCRRPTVSPWTTADRTRTRLARPCYQT